MRCWYSIILCGLVTVVYAQVDSDSIAYSIDLDDYVLTAQYEPTHYKKAIHRVEVIKQEDIKKLAAVTLQDALVLSTSVRQTIDPILGTSIRMRGISSSNVAILKDGVPVIGRLGGAIDISQISLQNVERIEIVEGALSNLYGNNAAGGVINLITKTSQVNKVEGSIDTQWETIGTQNHQVNLGLKKNGWTLNANGRYFNYDQWPADSLRLQELFYDADSMATPVEKYPFDPKFQYSAGSWLRYDFDNEAFVSLRYDYNYEKVSNYGFVRRPQINPYGEDQFFRTSRNDWTLNAKLPLDRVIIEQTLAFNQFDRFVEDKRFYLETQEFDSLLQSTDTTHFESIFSKSTASFTINESNTAIVGFMLINDLGYGDRIINRDLEDSSRVEIYELSPFLEWRNRTFESLDLAISGRYTHHSLYGGRFTPSIHTKWQLSDKLNLRVGYAQGFRSPALKELYIEFIDIAHYILGNADLRPEISHDIQSTIDYEWRRGVSLSLNTFYTRIQDRITLFEFEPNRLRYGNVSQYAAFGFQPSLQMGKRDWQFSSSASLVYWTTNLDVDGAPDYGHTLDWTNTFNYTLPWYDLSLYINHRYTGQQPRYRVDIEDNLSIGAVESFNMVDFSISKTIWDERLTLRFGANNVLDVQLLNVSGNASGGAHSPVGRSLANQGRSFFASVNVQF